MTTEPTNAGTLFDAAERFAAAETAVREATRRLRAADAELEAARVAYDAAQDLEAPED